MEQRRRIRDFTYSGERWIASLLANETHTGVWSGQINFFLDAPAQAVQLQDGLVLEALAFEELVSQASALSVEEMQRRLGRLRPQAVR